MLIFGRDGQQRFLLEIETGQVGLDFYVDGSRLRNAGLVDGQLDFVLWNYDGGDALRRDKFNGSYLGEDFSGTYILEYEGVPGVPSDPIPWRAEKIGDDAIYPAPDRQIVLDDFAGFWGVEWRGIKRDHGLSLNEAGLAFLADYLDMDDPVNLCLSDGLIRSMQRGVMTAFDIYRVEDQLKFYHADGDFRTVFLDGRDFPHDIKSNPMGYSIGRFNDGVLTIETRGFSSPLFYNSSGFPVSEQAVLTERMWRVGEKIYRDMRLHDPAYYTRDLRNFGTLSPRSTASHQPRASCNPAAFFRLLQLTGDLDEYFQRQRNR